MITLYCWNDAQKAGLLLSPELLRSNRDELRASPDVYWIDLDNPTPEEERLVFEEFFCVHRLTRDEIGSRPDPGVYPSFPRAEAYADYLFVVANPLAHSFRQRLDAAGKAIDASDDHVVTQLNAVLTGRLLITHHRQPLEAINTLRGFLSRHEEQAGRGPDYLFHLVLDAMVDEFAPVLDRLSATLEEIEGEIFDKPRPVQIQRLVALKRLVILLRKTLVYEREVLVRMSRGDFALIEAREIAYYRFVYDHVVRFTELIESAREMISDLMQLHLSVTSNKMNEIMKVLTMISTTVLPMALVTGVYGMNFETMPEIKWELGYPMALGLMALAGLGSLAFFVWRKWI